MNCSYGKPLVSQQVSNERGSITVPSYAPTRFFIVHNETSSRLSNLPEQQLTFNVSNSPFRSVRSRVKG